LKKKRSSCASGSDTCLHFERVLRREHQERLRDRVLRAADGDVLLLHRLEQRGLRLRRGAVDFIRQEQVRKHRPRLEAERFLPVLILGDDVCADDVRRHQVRRELDARELEIHRLPKRAHQHRLASPGTPVEQHMPAGEERDQHAFDDVVLPDHHFMHLVEDPLERGAEGLDGGFKFRLVAHGWE